MADEPRANDAIKVMCRFRPMNKSETSRKDEYLPKFPNNNKNQVLFCGRTYTFDQTFGSNTTQLQLYEGAAKPIVADVLQGYNGTIFAYGQTGSGKTHSMEGLIHDNDMKGVIPRIVQDIFEHIYTLDENLEFHIKVSYIEIYLDKIRDLLDITKTSLPVHEDANRVPYVKGATERFVATPEEVMQVMDEGKLNRKVASTKMNADSSRSHSIFLINVKQENMATETKLSGKLYLVDLAGSEKVGKTGAEGETLEEAKNINKSLSALGNVISALAEGTKTHIPYRDSKMTRILQDSLGGNCRTTIIICCSPSSFNDCETKSTLLFGVRAKTIKNTVQANVELTAEQWKRKFEKEEIKSKKYERLYRAAREELEKWRGGENIGEGEQVDFGTVAAYTAPTPTLDEKKNKGEKTGEKRSKNGSGDSNSARIHEIVENDQNSTKSASKTSIQAPENSQNETAHITGTLSQSDAAQVQELYNQMDDKDEQISQLSQLVESLKEQLVELESLLIQNKTDNDDHDTNIAKLQAEHDQAKAEVNEVLSALEELAVNYDEKSQALDTKSGEVEGLANELQGKQQNLTKLQSELSNVTTLSETHRLRASDMLSGLLKDLYDMGIVSPSQIAQGVLNTGNGRNGEISENGGTEGDFDSGNDEFSKIDDEFTAARLLVSKVKSEVSTLVERCEKLDGDKTSFQSSLELKTKTLDETKLKLSQHENKVSTLSMCLKDVESKRRDLEDQVSELHEEIARLRCDITETDSTTKTDSNQVNEALETQKNQHKKQTERIRDEIDDKNEQIARLQEQAGKLSSEMIQLQTENEALTETKNHLASKLQSVSLVKEKQDQARSDLKGLEDTVTRELSSLHSLRKMFVKELTERAKKIAVHDASGVNPGVVAENGIPGGQVGSQVQRQRIIFLENNLDQLTKVHKTLVRDNSELRCELPKLEKKLRATAERVKSLEQALREAKEGANKDRKRYQQEVDRIKETVRNRYIAKKAQIGANIARPIRAGQAPGATFTPVSVNRPVGIRGGGLQVHGIRGGEI